MVSYHVEYFMKQGWFHAKLLAVFLLLMMQLLALWVRRKLQKQAHPYNNGWLRLLNEVPTILMIGIVVLVVLKPF